jgi:cytochrome c2
MLKRPIPSALWFLAGLTLMSIVAAMIAGTVIYLESKRRTESQADAITRGDWRAGEIAIARYGCGSCHIIPGITAANGQVGPDLTHVGERSALAGKLANDPEAMVRWLMHPQAVEPGSGMPEMGVSETDGRNIAAYLYAKD